MTITIVDILFIGLISITSYIWFKVVQVKKQLDKDGSVRAFIEKRGG